MCDCYNSGINPTAATRRWSRTVVRRVYHATIRCVCIVSGEDALGRTQPLNAGQCCGQCCVLYAIMSHVDFFPILLHIFLVLVAYYMSSQFYQPTKLFVGVVGYKIGEFT